MWHKYIGTDREAPRVLWPRVSAWLNEHPQLRDAWAAQGVFTSASVARQASTSPAPPGAGAPAVAEEEDLLPPGYDPQSLRFYPLDVEPIESIRIEVSGQTAALIRLAARSAGVSEGRIYEAGALMHAAHTTGSIAVLDPVSTARIRAVLAEEGSSGLAASADVFVAALVDAAQRTGLADEVLAALRASHAGGGANPASSSDLCAP